MKKFVIRRLLAKNWFWITAFVVIAIGFTLTFITIDFLGNLHFLIKLFLAAMFSVFISHTVLRIFRFLIVKINGAPFKVGDFVRILNGPYRNQLVEVDEVWKERKQVRVNLNGIATKKNEDIFSNIEIINIKK